MKHLNIRIHGRVQGVFFRQSAKETAKRLGVDGFARNEPDGTVYIEAEGDEEALERFRNWCEQGPEFANVERVESESGEVKDYGGFEIR